MPYDAQTSRAAAFERGDGVAELAFAARGPETAIAHLYQHDPCRILFPKSEAGDPRLAVLVTTSGGLAGGDRLRLGFAARDGAAASITTQAAEKVYRSLGPDSRIAVGIDVGRAWLEWLPQETILFDGARLDRRTLVDVATDGKFLGCEMLVFGRKARGERFARGFVHDGWQVRRDAKLSWADAVRLEGDVEATLKRPMAFDGSDALASAILVAGDAGARLETARALIGQSQSRAGVTVVNGILVARFLGHTVAVRRDLTEYLAGVRQAYGLPGRLPRVWHH